jgi:YggT family protein
LSVSARQLWDRDLSRYLEVRMSFVINLIQTVAWVLNLIIIVDVAMSYFLPPYHSLRVLLDRIVQPMLRPIQRVVPPIGGIDFSPIILFLIIQVIEMILVNLLGNIRVIK